MFTVRDWDEISFNAMSQSYRHPRVLGIPRSQNPSDMGISGRDTQKTDYLNVDSSTSDWGESRDVNHKFTAEWCRYMLESCRPTLLPGLLRKKKPTGNKRSPKT